ncbi:MAG: hypothetical protein E7409_07205, partial [Ruminococcaceae bacterium]|nr:hypothetical protein [Oscillospiraceae bacterium]
MKKRMISLALTLAMLLSAMPISGVLAMEDGATTESILIGETFNDVVTGGLPDDVFAVKRAGSGDMSVMAVPDARNKSLYMTTQTDGTTYIEKEIVNPENAPLTLGFKMMPGNLGSFSLVNIVDDAGNVTPVFEVTDGKIMKDGEELFAFETNRWYYMEVAFNITDKAFTLAVDNQKLIKKTGIKYNNFAALRFQLSATTQELYLDDITMYRADLLTGERKYFEGSRLFL